MVSLIQRAIEALPSVRWHCSRFTTQMAYRRALGSLGRGTVIVRPHKFQGMDRIHIGSDCAVFDGSWLACEPGGGPLRIGDGNYLGHGVHIHAIDPITIGSTCVLADGVFIATTDHDRSDRHQVHGTGAINIGDRVFVGQRAVVLGGVTIGDGATIGSHAVVTRDVAAGATVVGIPAREIKKS